MVTKVLDLANLSPATQQELELWGHNLASNEAEVFVGSPPATNPLIVDLLRANALKAYLIAEADKHLMELVYRARTEGVSWRKIGQALGITGEAARQRYSPHP